MPGRSRDHDEDGVDEDEEVEGEEEGEEAWFFARYLRVVGQDLAPHHAQPRSCPRATSVQ